MQSDSNARFAPKKILIAIIAVLFSSYIAYAAGLITSVLSARALGPDAFGRLSYFVWLTGIIVIIFNNGITVTVIRYAAESVGRGDLATASMQTRWLRKTHWQIICVITVIGVGIYANLGIDLTGIPALLSYILLIGSAIAKSAYIFDVSTAKGYGNFNIEAKISSALSIFSAFATFIAFLTEQPLFVFVTVFVLTSLLHPAFSLSMTKDLHSKRHSDDGSFMPNSTFRSHLYWSALLCIIALAANRTAETYLLNSYFTSRDVANFIIAATLSRVGLDAVSVGINAVLMPVLGHAMGLGGRAQVDFITCLSFKLMFFIGLFVSGCSYFIANSLITLLYGSAYSDATSAFRLLILSGGFALAGGTLGAFLSTTDQQKPRALIALFCAAVQTLVAIIFVPRFGLWGAVFTTSIGSLLSIFVLFIYCLRTQNLAIFSPGLLFLALIFTIVIFVAHIRIPASRSHIGDIAMSAGFGVSLVLLSFLFKIWKKAELHLLTRMLRPGSRAYRIAYFIEQRGS